MYLYFRYVLIFFSFHHQYLTHWTAKSVSGISSGIKWFQPPPDRSCGGLNRGPSYQVQRLSQLDQLTIDYILIL
jgi:hypothetical protein